MAMLSLEPFVQKLKFISNPNLLRSFQHYLLTHTLAKLVPTWLTAMKEETGSVWVGALLTLL
jgi:hypothetical protein